MLTYTITTYPSKILKNVSRTIRREEFLKMKKIISDMAAVMKKNNGIGLAAPQVGLNMRLAIVKTKDGIIVLLNPKIMKKSWKQEIDEEGCLSVPGVFVLVKRPYKIKVVTTSMDGKEIVFEAKGLFARVIQHEVDHLNGILFIDKAVKITQGKDRLEEYNKNLKLKIEKSR